MQVSVEKTGDLERKMTVQVPAERIENEVTNRLQDLARRVKISGFRPGKVPFKVVKSRYDGQVRSEVVSEVMQQTYREALEQEQLNPAGGPNIEPRQMEPGQGLEYSATFEVYPEIELNPVDDVTIERPKVEVTDADVDKMVEKLQAQRTTWDEVDREAKEGDQVVVNFEGTIDGEPFSGNQGEQVPVVLGAQQMVPGFEDQLTGAKAGEKRTVEVTFPDDYHGQEVAGKTARFDVEVVQVNEPKLPELDDDFARSFGIQDGGMDGLRAEIRNNMERELEQKVRSKIKEQVMDALLERNEIEVPGALVEEEIDRSIQQAQQNQQQLQGMNLPREIFQESARRRVALGLLLGEVMRANDVQLDADRLRSTLESVASTYDDPQQVMEMYQKNQNMRRELEGHVLEEQVVDLLLDRMQAAEKEMSFDELMNADEGSAG